MNKRLGALALLAASVSLPSMVAAATDTFPAKPMFKVGQYHNEPIPPHPAASNLPQWNGSYVDLTGKIIWECAAGAGHDPQLPAIVSGVDCRPLLPGYPGPGMDDQLGHFGEHHGHGDP